MASHQLFMFFALICTCYGFTLPQRMYITDEVETFLDDQKILVPTIYIMQNIPQAVEDQYMLEELPTEDDTITRSRSKRQNQQPSTLQSGQRGQIDIYAENRRKIGTDVNVQATGRLWESRDGRSALDANANYQRHFGGQSGTGRPNYGGGINFSHRF